MRTLYESILDKANKTTTTNPLVSIIIAADAQYGKMINSDKAMELANKYYEVIDAATAKKISKQKKFGPLFIAPSVNGFSHIMFCAVGERTMKGGALHAYGFEAQLNETPTSSEPGSWTFRWVKPEAYGKNSNYCYTAEGTWYKVPMKDIQAAFQYLGKPEGTNFEFQWQSVVNR